MTDEQNQTKIANPSYVLSVESYHDQIPIGPEYNLLTHFLLRELRTLPPLRWPTMVHTHLHRVLQYYKYALGFLEPGESVPILHWKLDYLKCLA